MLLAPAARRRLGRTRWAVSLALFVRAATGYSPILAALGRRRRMHDARVALAGPGGVHVRASERVRVRASAAYGFWRDARKLARALRHVERVDVLDRRRSHWVAVGPAGTRLEWDAEIINEVPNRLIAWRTIDEAGVISAGSVHFRPVGEDWTDIAVHLQYEPPAGRIGAWIASALGAAPEQTIPSDLHDLGRYLERAAGVAHAART